MVSYLMRNSFRPNHVLSFTLTPASASSNVNVPEFASLFQHLFCTLPCLKYNHEVFGALVGRFGRSRSRKRVHGRAIRSRNDLGRRGTVPGQSMSYAFGDSSSLDSLRFLS